jgi:hypothetical protein
VFPANQPSATLTAGFLYEDVGSVVLNLRDSAGNAASTSFVVKPAVIDFASISRPRGSVANPGAKDEKGPGFAMAGEPFSIAIQACTYALDTDGKPTCGKPLPNFGNEGMGVAIEQSQPSDPVFVKGTSTTLANGVFTGTGFHVDDVGVVYLTPRLFPADYLGAGDALVVPPRAVGRFYPAFYTTGVNPTITPCLPKMNCLPVRTAGGDDLMTGAVYSGQPFSVTIRAFNTAGAQLKNYIGKFARDIQLVPVTAPGGASLVPIQSGAFAPAKILASQVASPTTIDDATFKLPSVYSNANPPSAKASGPTPFFLRATSTEQLASGVETISSQRVGSSEQGATVIAGRMQLANAFGSELLKLPVPMKAQYWTGTAWENNANDNVSRVVYDASIKPFSKCTRRLASDAAGTCSDVLKVLGSAGVTLNNGAGNLWLAPPGNGNIGSGLLDMTGKGSPLWLPTTLARVTFGIYQSPLIYIREIY